MQSTNVLENPRFESSKATKVQALKTDQLAVDSLYLKTGQQHGPMRLPERDRAIVVLSGEVTVVLHEQPVELRLQVKAGGTVLAPKGQWHTILNTGGDAVLLLTSLFPVRVEERG